MKLMKPYVVNFSKEIHGQVHLHQIILNTFFRTTDTSEARLKNQNVSVTIRK